MSDNSLTPLGQKRVRKRRSRDKDKSPRSVTVNHRSGGKDRDSYKDREKEKSNRTENMYAILQSKELKGLFKLFMESIHAQENVLFYEDVQYYENISPTNLHLMREKYEEIIDNYIIVGSQYEINISVTLRERILRCEPVHEIFNDARDHVLRLMCQSVPMFMSQAKDDVRLINMKKISLPVIMVDIVEELKHHDHHIKHWSIDVEDKKLAPYLERISGVLTVIPDIRIDDLSGRELGGLLKVCLLSLPISVITAELPIFFEIILERENYLGKNGDLKELISTLPPINQSLLHMITEMLHSYGHNTNTYNEMGELFAPLLIRNQRKQNNDSRTLAYLFDQYENLFLTPDFRCVREENIAYTGLSSYPQIIVDLFTLYDDDIKKRSNFSSDRTLRSSDWEIILLCFSSIIIIQASQELQFSEDRPIIEQGIPNLHFYMIKKGSARVIMTDDEGVEKEKGYLLAENDIIGELSLFTLKEANATVLVSKDSLLAKIYPPDLIRLFNEDQILAKRFYSVVATKLSHRLRTHEPSLINSSRSLKRYDTKLDIENYRDKFSIEDDDEKILKKFNIRNGQLWIGKKFLGLEEISLFANRRHKTPLKDIKSVDVNRETLTIRLDILKKENKLKKIKFSTNTVEDLNQILVLLENNKEMILPLEVNMTNSPKSIPKHDIDTKLSDEEWEILLGGSSIVELHEGDIIIEQGKKLDKMYLLSRGSATANLHKEEEVHFLGMIEQGEIIGEISFLQDCKSTCIVIANEDTLIYYIDKQYIELLFHSFPKLASKFFRHLCRVLCKRIIQRENVPAEILSDVPSMNMNRKRLGLEKTLSRNFSRSFSGSPFMETLQTENVKPQGRSRSRSKQLYHLKDSMDSKSE